jgi:hypothetical protein
MQRTSKWRIAATHLAASVLLFGASFVPSAARAATLSCSGSTTLEALVGCIVGQMPQRNSNGYVVPTSQQLTDFRTAVNDMLSGTCSSTLPANIAANMQRRTFTDSQNGKTYCLLMETQDADGDGYVDKGWGTFITDGNAVRQISHQAPHPIYDGDTANQAIGIFKHTDSRSFLMCGAHRHANGTTGGCQSSYGPADCAHNKANLFTAANQQLDTFYGAGAWTAIQWHGMAADSCGTVSAYMTQGFNATPAATTKLALLKQMIADDQPNWDVRDPGDGGCTLNATTNVQGHILNGVNYSNACSGTSSGPIGDKFIHIEQKPGAYQVAANWTQAVRDAWCVTNCQVDLAPSGDTYARDGGSAGTNYGSATEIQVRTSSVAGNTRQGFLKFDIVGHANVAAAKLRLYVAQSGTSEDLDLQVRAVATTSWSESTLNWNNKPAMGQVLGSITASGTGYVLYEFDVTSYVNAELAAGRTTMSFGLFNPSSNSPYIKVASDEAAANKPALRVQP